MQQMDVAGNTLMGSVLNMAFIFTSSSSTMCFMWSITIYIFFNISTNVISLIKNSKLHWLYLPRPFSSTKRS
ncbi:hypothetical protein MtrunA17_Chr1g0159381 [Medicago truncatula]|uniref:Transmembrane protein n=1 Tax=Medicago truncatula TaxID=3880 RepID=A0A396JNL2_MEDTR|nr:hypothetical protein MtrunA17_Chr1g0159381 [Medicago truncatula]